MVQHPQRVVFPFDGTMFVVLVGYLQEKRLDKVESRASREVGRADRQ